LLLQWDRIAIVYEIPTAADLARHLSTIVQEADQKARAESVRPIQPWDVKDFFGPGRGRARCSCNLASAVPRISRNNVLFAPLVTQKNHLACELSIALLRQQPPGQLLGEGGDIDNRLKTLLDALRMPSKLEAQQAHIDTRPDDDPIHCLLQDDSLVTKVSVETDRLLRPADDRFDLVAIIQVRVLVTTATMANIGFESQTQ
jgi:hypothetical protein